MSKTKSTKKAATKSTESKAQQEKKERVPKGDLMTFALRMPKATSAALHEAAGPRRASRVMEGLANAFIAGDEAAFKAIVKEAREAQS